MLATSHCAISVRICTSSSSSITLYEMYLQRGWRCTRGSLRALTLPPPCAGPAATRGRTAHQPVQNYDSLDYTRATYEHRRMTRSSLSAYLRYGSMRIACRSEESFTMGITHAHILKRPIPPHVPPNARGSLVVSSTTQQRNMSCLVMCMLHTRTTDASVAVGCFPIYSLLGAGGGSLTATHTTHSYSTLTNG